MVRLLGNYEAMNVVATSKVRRVRISDTTSADFIPLFWLRETIDTSIKETLDAPIQAEVEFCVPIGGVTRRALVGAMFQPASKNLELDVGYVPVAGSQHHETPLGQNVYVGLIREYADSVLAGLRSAATTSDLTGTITVASAGLDPVGSSPMMFQEAARLLLRVVAHLADGRPLDSFDQHQLNSSLWSSTGRSPSPVGELNVSIGTGR
jgi:hypothetical protein